MPEEKAEEMIAPVIKTATVRCGVADAFRIFTERIATWWPLESHSVGGSSSESCFVEERVGGRLYERLNDGRELAWGKVLEWSPPDRLAFTWYPGRGPDTAQTVEVTFTAVGEGTRVELTHSGWEILGERAIETRDAYDTGWEFVLGERYVAGCREEAASG